MTPETPAAKLENVDPHTVAGFGDEWSRFTQDSLDEAEVQRIFDDYFSIFPWHELPDSAAGADVGCGSGRWAVRVAPRVGRLTCIDASEVAVAVARRALAAHANAEVVCASVARMPIAPASLDFCYSLGVLHHVPDTESAIRDCAALLKPGAPMLLYLYYALEDRPAWFRALWRASDLLRIGISRLPHGVRNLATDLIAATVYWPLSRLASLAEIAGANVANFPLAYYRRHSFYTLRTDARDRFGTRLEQRFTLAQIEAMMRRAGLEQLVHSPRAPFWCVVGRRSAESA